MGSLCDQCARPGVCCQRFVLSTGVLRDGAAEDVDDMLTRVVTCTSRDGSGSFIHGIGAADFLVAKADTSLANVRLGLPYKRLSREADGQWRYWCPVLGVDGKCSDYANRPAVCRALQAGEGTPCCHFVKGIGACPERVIDHFLAGLGGRDKALEPIAFGGG